MRSSRRLAGIAGLAGLALGLGACAHGKAGGAAEATDFACKERALSYVVTGHLSGDELGVQVDCASEGPRLLRWKVDRAGKRVDDRRAMTPGEFDKVWSEVDGTGWRYLKDCDGSGAKHDPLYTFDLKDDSDKASFTCQARTVPYPYDAIVNQLDLAANVGRPQLGGEDPDVTEERDR